MIRKATMAAATALTIALLAAQGAAAQDAPIAAEDAPAMDAMPITDATPDAMPAPVEAAPMPAAAAQPRTYAPATIAGIEPPAAGLGQIVFFRSSSVVGAALGCQITENGARISALGRGKFFVHDTTPGPHSYTVSSEAKDVLNVEVEEGETQYVRCNIKMGIMVGRPNIAPSDKAEFDKAAASLKPVDADDIGPKTK